MERNATIYKSKKTLTELAEDEEFATRAERFLEGIGKNENITVLKLRMI